MDYLLITYGAYIIITLILTFWVGRTLYTNGKIFLMKIISNDEVVVDSVNRLLLIGLYLINFGFVLQNLITRRSILTATDSVELLSSKIGTIVVILGIMHFLNLFALFILKSKTRSRRITEPEKPLISNT